MIISRRNIKLKYKFLILLTVIRHHMETFKNILNYVFGSFGTTGGRYHLRYLNKTHFILTFLNWLLYKSDHILLLGTLTVFEVCYCFFINCEICLIALRHTFDFIKENTKVCISKRNLLISANIQYTLNSKSIT